MPVQGQQISIGKPRIGYGNLDESTVYAPFRIDLRNGYLDDAGDWVKRYGSLTKTDLGTNKSVDILIPREGGYTVSNQKIYRTVLGTPVEMTGVKMNGSYRKQFAVYDDKIMLVDGGTPRKIVANVTSTLSGAPVGTKYIARVGSRTLYAGSTTFGVQYSNVNNPEIIDGTINVKKNNEVTGLVDFNNNTVVSKVDAFEVWGLGGASANLALRTNSSLWNAGTDAGYSIIKANNTIYWKDTDGHHKEWPGKVITGSYYKYLRDNVTNPKDCYGFHYIRENCIRWFYPTEGICIRHDYKNGHTSLDSEWSGSGWQRLRHNAYMELDGMQYFGSFNNDGLIHEWDESHKDDNGTNIRVYEKFKVLLNSGMNGRVNEVRYQLKRGVADVTTTNPTMTHRYKFDDEGWKERTIDLGVVGDTAIWATPEKAFGRGIEITNEIIMSDPTSYILQDMKLTVQPLGN